MNLRVFLIGLSWVWLSTSYPSFFFSTLPPSGVSIDELESVHNIYWAIMDEVINILPFFLLLLVHFPHLESVLMNLRVFLIGISWTRLSTSYPSFLFSMLPLSGVSIVEFASHHNWDIVNVAISILPFFLLSTPFVCLCLSFVSDISAILQYWQNVGYKVLTQTDKWSGKEKEGYRNTSFLPQQNQDHDMK